MDLYRLIFAFSAFLAFLSYTKTDLVFSFSPSKWPDGRAEKNQIFVAIILRQNSFCIFSKNNFVMCIKEKFKPLIEEKEKEAEETEKKLMYNSIVTNKEYPFCIYRESMLREVLSGNKL